MKIRIKKKNIGKFNATKKRTGKTTEELTHSKNPLTRKRAIFAQNAKRWAKKHDEGGYLDDIIWDNSGQWSYPGQITGITGTKNGTDITMQGVADYLIGKDNLGNVKFMKPGKNYHFKGSSVVEYPIKYQLGGLFKKKEIPNYLYSTYGLNDYGQPRYKGSYSNPVFGYKPISIINQSIGREYSAPDYNAVAITSTPLYMNEDTVPRQMDLVDLKNRQLFAESRGNEKAKSHRGASGLYQIMPDTAAWYAKQTGNTGDIWDPIYNEQIRDWLMDQLYNYDWAKSAKTDEERWRRAYAGYNWGSGNMSKAISKYGDDWFSHAPKETRDYVTFIIDNVDVGKHLTNDKYNETKASNKYFRTKQYGGTLPKPFSYSYIPEVRYQKGGRVFQETNSNLETLFDKYGNSGNNAVVNQEGIITRWSSKNGQPVIQAPKSYYSKKTWTDEDLQAKRNYAYNNMVNMKYPIVPKTKKWWSSELQPDESCIYTATGAYGTDFKAMGNKEFSRNPLKYGFEEIPVGSMRRGDLFQFHDYNGIPIHMMMFDSINPEGQFLFHYSNGSNDPEDSTAMKHYAPYLEKRGESDIYRGVIGAQYANNFGKAYRFIGRPVFNYDLLRDYIKDKYNR